MMKSEKYQQGEDYTTGFLLDYANFKEITD